MGLITIAHTCIVSFLVHGEKRRAKSSADKRNADKRKKK